jgi:hypothetical protein
MTVGPSVRNQGKSFGVRPYESLAAETYSTTFQVPIVRDL